MVEKEDNDDWYERALPKPPVPPLDHTLDRYLEYAAVVAAGQKRPLHETQQAVEQFRRDGLRWHKQLEEIAEREPNWVNTFWLPEMYLRIRIPLPVNSSPAYVFPQRTFANEEERLKYTALLVRGICDYKDKVDKRGIDREVSTGREKVHMCMQQYDRILSCYREPGEVEDRQLVKARSNKHNEHILVMCQNQAFIVHTRWAGDLLPLPDVLHQLREVRSKAAPKALDTVQIGGASAGDRTTAALFWKEMSEAEENVKSLRWAKQALFVVCLDDVEEKNGKTGCSLPERGKHLLVGGGSRQCGFNRWYDATIQLVVGSNGTSGLCIEHSTVEGIVIINMAEAALLHVERNWNSRMVGPSPMGLCTVTSQQWLQICQEERNFSGKPLTWHVSEKAKELIEKQRSTFDEHASELDLNVVDFSDFGKDLIKKIGFSPDGFIQLAMQLAHYNLHGYLVSTYESASIRRFAAGRVDNIRANTQEALEWVTQMKNEKVAGHKKLELLRKAAEKQAKITAENISGYGIDNHLCALWVIARDSGETVPPLFQDPLFAEVMRFPLSTSQVTTSSDIADCYLCYGAVVRDGYGCSYNLQPDRVIFAPSAFKSNPRTDLSEFSRHLSLAMRQMRQLVTTNQ